MKTFRFLIGTHASAGLDSLCFCEADFKAEAFTALYTMQDISEPTYLALSSDRILYTFGKTAAGVSVYAIREQAVISSLPCASGGPCHISVDERGEFLLVAGYGSGTVSLYDLNTDGSIRGLCLRTRPQIPKASGYRSQHPPSGRLRSEASCIQRQASRRAFRAHGDGQHDLHLSI